MPDSLSTLVTREEPQSSSAEAYRQLRTNLLFARIDRPLRSLLVTSADSDEGKTAVLANLGVVLAELGKTVTLVDGDLRRPSLHQVFGLDNSEGLTDLLFGDGSPGRRLPAGDAVKAIPYRESGVTGLRVVTTGRDLSHPAELLASQRMTDLLRRMTDEADFVLVDAPPVTTVADASLLAPRLDGALLVLHAGKTRRQSARQAKQQLEQVGAHILGVVLCDVRGIPSQQRY